MGLKMATRDGKWWSTSGWIGVVPKFSHGAIIWWLETQPTWEPLALKSLNHWSGSDS
jgi:hypothetical protein